jgi:CheY-like chemotaxis protein
MRPFHVLIVDDQHDARSMLRAGLETLETRLMLTDVPSGEEAILVIASQPVDLLVADIRLPGISGFELKERARKRNPDIKVILITGVTDPHIREKVVKAGAEAYFFKPVEMGDFLSTVERCLGLTREVKDASAPVIGVTDRLGNLRQTLQAVCAVLISDNGNIVAQAGNLPADIEETSLVHSLLVTLDVTYKFSLMAGAVQPDDYMVFSGGVYDLALANVGQTMGLLLIAPAGWAGGKQAKNLRKEMHKAVKDFLVSLPVIGFPVSALGSEIASPGPVEVEEEPEEAIPLLNLEALLVQAEKVEKVAVDAFWDAAAVEDPKGIAGADTITYEQAKTLGLAPEGD